MRLLSSCCSHQGRDGDLSPIPHPPYPWLRNHNVRPAFIGDTGPKLKECSRPFSYALMDKIAPGLRLVWPSAMSPMEKLGETLLRCVEEQRSEKRPSRLSKRKGIIWEGDGDVVENVDIGRFVGLRIRTSNFTVIYARNSSTGIKSNTAHIFQGQPASSVSSVRCCLQRRTRHSRQKNRSRQSLDAPNLTKYICLGQPQSANGKLRTGIRSGTCIRINNQQISINMILSRSQ